jgi:hypothetical protein
MHYLSKSRYMQGLSCPRQLWVAVHEPDRIPETDASTQAAFDIGHAVGEVAKRRHPNGVEIDRGSGATGVTRREMIRRVPLFEASFSHGSCYCKTDILVPVDEEEWDLVEVKASTTVKEEHLLDVAFQRFVVEGAGVKVRRCHVMYLNNEYALDGEVDLSLLFEMEDVTEQLDLGAVPVNVEELLKVLDGHEPRTTLGVDCVEPRSCPFCLPPNELLWLSYFGKRAWPLLQQGITKLVDLPHDVLLTDKQKLQKKVHKSRKPHVDGKRLGAWLRSLSYPLYILDFETFSAPVPFLTGMRPYQNIPFQFSLHTVSADGRVTHTAFLAAEHDPRPSVVAALKAVGPAGTVLAHHMSFERGVIEDLASLYPAESHWLHALVARLRDSEEPFQKMMLYHPSQQGSSSLKKVYPAWTGKDYSSLEIQEGGTASREYYRVTYTSVSDEERTRVRAALLLYCNKDTEAVVKIISILNGMLN